MKNAFVNMRRISLELVTVSGRKGIINDLKSGYEPMEWDRDGDDETESAEFSLYEDGELISSYSIDGDDWRSIEEYGDLSKVWFWVNRRVHLAPTIDACVQGCDPEGRDQEYEQEIDELQSALRDVLEYAERYADANDEAADGACRQACRAARALLPDGEESANPRDERDGVSIPDGVTVHRYLDLSTCHLDEETARSMSDGDLIPGTEGCETSFGYQAITSSDDGEQYGHIAAVLPVDEESERHWPQCLRDVWALARAVGADYVRFDRDASTAAGLPVYEW